MSRPALDLYLFSYHQLGMTPDEKLHFTIQMALARCASVPKPARNMVAARIIANDVVEALRRSGYEFTQRPPARPHGPTKPE
jgi:hypothetical protein